MMPQRDAKRMLRRSEAIRLAGLHGLCPSKVAVRAKVSRATAWRALRTTKGIDASTAERIADAVEAMAAEVEKKFRK